MREEAKQQVAEYETVCEQLAETEQTIEHLNEELTQQEMKRNRLTVVHDNYDTYERYLDR